MATINSINNISNPLASTAITIDPGASGDSYIQYNEATVAKFRVGVDDSDSDAFVVSVGSALGTSNVMRVSASGEINFPLNPLFMASLGDENNSTGDGTTLSIGSAVATTQLFDVGGDYSPGNGAGTPASFTAPITGLYYLQFQCVEGSPVGGGQSFISNIVTSNRTYSGLNNPTRNKVANFFGGGNLTIQQQSTLADMDVSDTVTWTVTSTGGAKTDDVQGQAGRPFITGTLLF